MRIAIAGFFLSFFVLSGCSQKSYNSVLSGTSETRVVRGDSSEVVIRVFYPSGEWSKINEELDRAEWLAKNHCARYSKQILRYLASDVDNSFFKTVTYQCLTASEVASILKANGANDEAVAKQTGQKTNEDKCREIGFQPNTEKFGDCVLRLMEMGIQSTQTTTVIQSQPNRASPTTADKIEGTKQILEAIQSVTTPAQSNGKQIDLGCVNVCQAQGKSLMYCRSDCAY